MHSPGIAVWQAFRRDVWRTLAASAAAIAEQPQRHASRYKRRATETALTEGTQVLWVSDAYADLAAGSRPWARSSRRHLEMLARGLPERNGSTL